MADKTVMKSRLYRGVHGPTFFPVNRRYRRSIAVQGLNVSHHRPAELRVSFYHHPPRLGESIHRSLLLHFHACGWNSSLSTLPDERNSGFKFNDAENHFCSYDNLQINATKILMVNRDLPKPHRFAVKLLKLLTKFECRTINFLRPI
jgi:hypothetical protein